MTPTQAKPEAASAPSSARSFHLIHDDAEKETMTMIWLLLDALGAVLACLLEGVFALVDLISPGWRDE